LSTVRDTTSQIDVASLIREDELAGIGTRKRTRPA
jgi:hypothetical protein